MNFSLNIIQRFSWVKNNARIKPYMTDSAFSEEEANQNKAINQVYKDYMLDYRFESASIYVNTESNVALAEVTYQVNLCI